MHPLQDPAHCPYLKVLWRLMRFILGYGLIQRFRVIIACQDLFYNWGCCRRDVEFVCFGPCMQNVQLASLIPPVLVRNRPMPSKEGEATASKHAINVGFVRGTKESARISINGWNSRIACVVWMHTHTYITSTCIHSCTKPRFIAETQ